MSETSASEHTDMGTFTFTTEDDEFVQVIFGVSAMDHDTRKELRSRVGDAIEEVIPEAEWR